MTTPYQAPQPVRFFLLPDGKPSTIQMKVGADGQPAPVAVQTPQQLAEWDQIQAARPLGNAELDAATMKSLVRPLFDAKADHDVGAPDRLDKRRFEAKATGATRETPAPRTKQEWQQRADDAAKLAASLGLQLVLVRDDPVMGVPRHLELRQPGNPFGYQGGDLTSLEVSLRNLAEERAKREQQIAAFHANQQQRAREAAERIAAQPEHQIAVLKAKLAEQGITV